MRGDITLFILKTIQIGVTTVTALSDTINEYSIQSTMRRFYGRMPKEILRRPILEKKIAALKERQRISKVISKLKSEGFINKDKKGFLKITSKGKNKIKKIEIKQKQNPDYKSQQSSKIIIITFDIPELYRLHRYWLRLALKQLGFTMLQKSVWIGKVELPEEFLEDLRKRNIFDFVEIFAVTKSGTLKQLQ